MDVTTLVLLAIFSLADQTTIQREIVVTLPLIMIAFLEILQVEVMVNLNI
jgi:hypothetical protein